MKAIDVTRQAVTIKVEGAMLELAFSTKGDQDGGGNGAYPSTFTLRADQFSGVSQDPVSQAVSIDFYGAVEFREFRTAITILAQELEALYGRDLDRSRTTITRESVE